MRSRTDFGRDGAARASGVNARTCTIGGACAALLLLLLQAGGLAGQAPVRVVVRVTSEGAAVADATVTTGALSAPTDSAGRAVLALPAGPHTLRISAFGHATREANLVVRADTLVQYELEPEALEDEEIIVTTTRGERRIEDEPIRVEVLVQEEVEEKLLMTPGSIAMLLNETAGLRVQETSPALGGANIRIHGLRGRYTQLLADGLPLYGGQAGALGLLQIPPMDLRQVEVIKGAASALYGGSALGGVVNLISKRPADERELLLNVTTRAGADALVWLGGAGDRWGWTFLGGLHGQRRADVNDDAWSDIPSHRRVTLRPRIFFDAAGTRAMLTAGAMLEERRGGGDLTDGTPYAQDLETARLDVGATGQRFLTDALVLDVRASAAVTLHDHRYDIARERDRHSTTFSEASLRGQSGRHAWAAGVALQHDAYDARDVDGFDYGWWTPAAFAQDELTLGERLTLAVSARVDAHGEYGTFLSPRASVLVRPAGTASVRVSAGTGFFAPTPFTEETEDVGLRRVVPPENLEAERARSLAADVGLVLGAIEANLTLFGSTIDDAVAVRTSADGTFARLVNVEGETRARGTELLARYRREPWIVTASHTWTDASEPSPDDDGRRRRVPLTPRHMLGVVAAWERHGSARAGLELYYTGRQFVDDNPYRDTTEPYLIMGLLMEKRFGPVRAFLNLENLTDRRQTRYDPIVLPAPGPFGRRTTETWAPLEGRVFNGGIRVGF